MSDYSDALDFETFDEAAEYAEKTWILKNAIAIGEDSTWFGPPGSGKSALLLDMAVAIGGRGHCWQWHVYNINEKDPTEERRGTVYFALERANLTSNRIGAYKQRDKPSYPVPIAIVRETINLLDPKCVDQIIDTVWKFEKQTGVLVGLIIIDTFSKAIASGDEDKAQTQNLAATHLKKVHDCLDVHIATIGHTGKNEKAGERGSNARLGHVDLAVQISVDKNVGRATVVKANDQAEGLIAAFQMEEVTVVRKREDGTDREPYTTRILAPYDPGIFKKARAAVSKPPTDKQAQALEALQRVLEKRGKDGTVHVNYWKTELTNVGLLKADAVNPRVPFKRIREGLSQHIFEVEGDLVGLKPQPGKLSECSDVAAA
jgi:hypothetical protein